MTLSWEALPLRVRARQPTLRHWSLLVSIQLQLMSHPVKSQCPALPLNCWSRLSNTQQSMTGSSWQRLLARWPR